MRQLEEMVGPDGLRDGLREYLDTFAFHNATWNDLIGILDARTDEDLAAWSHAWVEEPGRPTISDGGEARDGHGRRAWRCRSQIPEAVRCSGTSGCSWRWDLPTATRITPAHMNGARVEIPSPQGLPAPLYILPNGGRRRLRAVPARRGEQRRIFLEHLPELETP